MRHVIVELVPSPRKLKHKHKLVKAECNHSLATAFNALINKT
jgi:hypothetical protein